MDTIRFENEALPIYAEEECLSTRKVHSEIAHWHDHLELILVKKGTILCQTAGTEFELHKGDVCFINRKQLHQIHEEREGTCDHEVLILGTGLLAQNPLVYEKYLRPMLEDPQFSHVRFAGATSPAGEISELNDRIKTLLKEQPLGYELDLIAAVHSLCKQLYLAYTAEPAPLPLDNNALIQQRMAEYIYENYAKPLGLDDIAKAGNVSRSQCAKLFKQYAGLSPIAFLNHHRLEVSRDKLRTGTDSVANLAAACGFSDQSYYNRLFLRAYGITPTAYRKGLKEA